MGGSTRFVLLLATPFSLLRPHSSSLYRLGRLSLRPLSSALSPHHKIILSPQSLQHLTINSSQRIHTQSNSLRDDNYSQQQQQKNQHPWPEWSKLVHTLSPAAEVHGIVPEDAFVSYEYLSEEFVRSASSCLAFARNRPDILGLLSRKHIEWVVENGTPFLFKSALDTGRRMRSFLYSTGINVVESDKAQTVDLMKYILSYASNPTVSSERNNLYSRECIESSVRSLLNELAEVICGVHVSGLPTPEQQQVSGYYGHTPRPLGQNIEMKKGDWICPRCSFMNFARNLKCLECEEARPKRQLTGGEWECPQCDFFNYGRNTVCLRCDCRHPGGASFGTVNSGSGLGHNNGDASVGRSLNQIIDHTSTFPATDNRNISGENTGTVRPTAPRSGSLQDRPPKGSNSGYVPFVPLPADMFAKKAKSSNMEDNEKVKPESSESVPSIVHDQRGTVSVRDESGTPGENFQLSEKPENEVENQNKKEQAEKSDRWFNRVAELHNVPDLTSAVSDEDFPEIMPMRKGENRFVVGKKKDRSLSSPTYKRQSAMEQADNTKFVPFVPFPPDYFAKKDKPPPDSSNATVYSTDEAYSISRSSGMTPVKSDEARRGDSNLNQESSTENQQIGRGNWSSSYSVNTGAPTSGYQTRSSLGSQGINNDNWNIKYSGEDNISQTGRPSIGSPSNTTFGSQSSTTESWSSRYPGKENAYQTGEQNAGNSTQNFNSTQAASNLAGTKTHSPANQNVRSGWTGKSLEGSAVKDPDPLDMSEEAKAERWFRRVAQIKDISELSQIPDEDFPSIMPMRKGVNRFVVSKRKTPLERRLTSPQYRRNLPIVSSDPEKKEND